MKKFIFTTAFGTVLLLLTGLVAAPLASAQLTNIELLGKYVFFDKISSPSRMACVTCHQPNTGGTGGVSGVNLHQVAITGANPHTIGNLKPPTNAYASFIDPFHRCNSGGLGQLNVCGGNFWNGRAEGNEFPPVFPAGATKHIGDEVFYTTDGTLLAGVVGYSFYFGPTADQALNPMPNLVEQNIDRQAVCQHVASAKYAKLYKGVWGVDIDCSNTTPVAFQAPDVDAPEYPFDISFKRIMLAVCAWQASADLNSFSSKRDIALRNDSDGLFPLDGFTAQENLGHDLFYNRRPIPFAPPGIPVGRDATGNLVFNNPPFPNLPLANCSFCHSDNPGVFPGLAPNAPPVVPSDTGVEEDQLYTAQDYHNIGTPPNPEIPVTFNSAGIVIDPDLGVAGHAGPPYPPGFFKTPTLRNVDKRKDNDFIKAYTHNGWFKSLENIVHFYNTALIGGATANSFGVTRCPEGVETEKDALAKNCWPAPAYGGGAIGVLVGNLRLTSEQEAAIVAYLKTFTDTFTPKQPQPYK